MKKFLELDKICHALAGYAICLSMMYWTGSLFSAIFLALAIGAFKELYDYVQKTGTPDWYDFWAVCIGTVLGVLASLIHNS